MLKKNTQSKILNSAFEKGKKIKKIFSLFFLHKNIFKKPI